MGSKEARDVMLLVDPESQSYLLACYPPHSISWVACNKEWLRCLLRPPIHQVQAILRYTTVEIVRPLDIMRGALAILKLTRMLLECAQAIEPQLKCGSVL